jgi:hypothetical protein
MSRPYVASASIGSVNAEVLAERGIGLKAMPSVLRLALLPMD